MEIKIKPKWSSIKNLNRIPYCWADEIISREGYAFNKMNKQNQADLDYNKIHAHYELLKKGVKSGAKCSKCGEDLLYKESEADFCADCAGEMGEAEDYD